MSCKLCTMNHITHALQALIAKRELNPLEASKRIETSASTLCRILAEEVLPSHKTLRAVVSNLATNADERREIALAWAMDEMERIGAVGLVGFSEVNQDENPEIKRLKQALLNQSESIEGIAELAGDIVSACTRIQIKARSSAGNTLLYPTHDDTTALVAEDAPAKKPRRK